MAKLSDLFRNIFYLFLIISLAQPVFKSVKNLYKRNIEPHTKVGYLEIANFIATSDYYSKKLNPLFSDPDIKAILLKIDSTGGVSPASESLFNEILELKKEHPKTIISFVENICTSGAYWVATATDHIIASPVSWVGSIGSTIPFQFKLKGFLEEHHIRYEETTTGDYKSSSNPFMDATPQQRAMLQKLCDQTYNEFVSAVARQRSKLSINEKDTWANGKIFLGREAQELGLVDEVGSKSNAIAWLREKTAIEGRIEWIKPERRSTFARFFGGEESNGSVVSVSSGVRSLLANLFVSHNNIPTLENQLAV